jgi:signal transduction histidine kinase
LRLADFITSQTESILQEWENFARKMKPAALSMTDRELRNHAALMLKMIAKDLRCPQTAEQQFEKSQGEKPGEKKDAGHGIARQESNFTVEQLVSEYRALRASVLKLWAQSMPLNSVIDIEDIIRFNEAIDQLLAASVFSFADAKRRADEAEKSRRNQFLAMLGHELRNPLSPISTAANILRRTKRGDPVIDNVSSVISRQVTHMAGLLDDLLDVSRVTRGMIEVKIEIVDICQVIGDAVEQVKPEINTRRQHLEVVVPPQAAVVQADKKRLVQVVTNLLANAAKYTPENGSVKLTATLHEREVVIAVEDNGIGMAREFVPQAFDLFTQAERKADRSQGGLGLGLALVKNLVELHGGKVACSSEGLGKGSQFTVWLPRHLGGDKDADRLEKILTE